MTTYPQSTVLTDRIYTLHCSVYRFLDALCPEDCGEELYAEALKDYEAWETILYSQEASSLVTQPLGWDEVPF